MNGDMGQVFLIGAGCGKGDLITVRGLKLLRTCDVVVYDDLIDRELLFAAPEKAEHIYMGKRQGRPSACQADIVGLLVDKARQGKRVARLKGGDPFIFGRGGEEMSALRSAGIPCEEVPGISSAIAIPAAAGIPVTHRGVSQSVHIITGHTVQTPDGLPEDLPRLAGLGGTLVFLMGLSRLDDLTRKLICAGKSPDTPAAVLSGGCSPHPVSLRGRLDNLASLAHQGGVKPPAVIVVGEAAALDFTPTVFRPLDGVCVGITGTRAIAERLRPLLDAQGAEVCTLSPSATEELPLIFDLEALCDGQHHWLAFTSANGVSSFFRHCARLHLDVRRLHACRIAVIGPGTGAALKSFGLVPELCAPPPYTSVSLAQALCSRISAGEDAVLLRSHGASDTLPCALAASGIAVRDVPLYSVRPAFEPPGYAQEVLQKIRYLVFSSAGGVRQFFTRHRSLPATVRCVCIGPVTANTLKSYISSPFLTAEESSAQAVVDAICCDAGAVPP